MCGFAGVVTWDEKYRVTQDTLEKMSRAIAHRGPDGEGYHLTRQNEPITPDAPQVGLAFRRLAILDPDPRSNQPFHIDKLTLVFNGEIYNFRELKSEISKLRPDYHWRTTGDTEVLLMAYDVWRENCVEKLNGMFAFAVWDEQKKELFLARDRMGQKPLFFCFLGGSGECMGGIVFSSEISPLPGFPGLFDMQTALNRPWLTEYLQVGYSRPGTIFGAIVELKPGTWLKKGPASGKLQTYFDASAAVKGVSRDLSSTTRTIVCESVKRQLISDVPLGVFLSGGVDSSVIACCARQFGPVQTFSIGFDDPRYDESQYAAAVASHLGTTHHQFVVSPAAIDDLPKLAVVYGEPFADSSALPTHYLARETRKHVKVALSGDGGDELFGGYDRYRVMKLERFIRRVPTTMRQLLAGPVTEELPSSHPKSVASHMKRFLKTLDQPPARRYASYLSLFDDALIEEMVGSPVISDKFEQRFDELLQHRDAVQAALAIDREQYLPNDLLTKVDRCSMMHGLEVRSPFMDHELVQFAAGLTTDQLLKGGPKRMLREAFAKDLPDFVFKRKKMGFAVPIGEWFRGELRPMLRDNLFASNSFGSSHFNMKVVERLVEEHETQRIDHSQRLYALLMLELWWQQQRQQ